MKFPFCPFVFAPVSSLFRFLIFIGFLAYSPGYAQVTWESVGPYGGWINDLTFDNTGRLLAATSFGGIYRSSNGGETWLQIFNDTLSFDPRSVATNSSGHIFVGSDGIDGVGFLRSTNDGTSWQVMPNALASRGAVNLLVTSTDTLYACTFDDGLYRSTDGGVSFTELSGLSATYVRDVEINSSGHLFAGTAFDGTFLYRSTDIGTTWQVMNTGITADVGDLFVSESDELYAATGTSVYRSTNDGVSWTNLNPPTGVTYNSILATPDGDIYSSFYGGTSIGGGVYRSTDDGSSWTQETGLSDHYFGRLVVSTGGTIYSGGYGPGVYSRSGGGTWERKVNGMANTFITAIDRDSNIVFIGTRHQQVFRSTDLGLTWEESAVGIPSYEWIYDLDVNVNGAVFASGAYGEIYRSLDTGQTWTSVYSVGATAIGCNAQGYVFAGIGSRVYRSTDNGDSWTFANLPSVQYIADLAFVEDTAYAATGTPFGSGSQGVYRSTDNGITWGSFNAGLTNLNVTTIYARDTAEALAACPPTSIGTDGDGVFDLEGETWILKGPVGSTMKAMARAKREGSVDWWLGLTAATLYAREDDPVPPLLCGLLFIANPNFESSKALILPPPPSSSYGGADVVYLLGSAGHGIQRTLNLISAVQSTDELPVETMLSQNYPNPFNPETRIAYRLGSRQPVVLKIYDLLGREVATLVDETRDPGDHEVVWDATGHASGVYYYRITAGGNLVETKKLVLLR